jgi:hypothetical protein
MSHNREIIRNQRPTFGVRMALWFSKRRRVDGLWVGVAFEDQPEPILRRVEAALRLIKERDWLRYDRLRRDLERVWVDLLPGGLGSFVRNVWACKLDIRFVMDEATSIEMIAATIVHEATHARLFRRGIGYEEALRQRVEAVCVRRELAFAAKLPNGDGIREYAERDLLQSPETWSNESLSERDLEGRIQMARHIRMPEWMIRASLTARRARIGVLGWFHGVRRANQP